MTVVCMCVHKFLWVHAWVHVCEGACVHVCVCVCVCAYMCKCAFFFLFFFGTTAMFLITSEPCDFIVFPLYCLQCFFPMGATQPHCIVKCCTVLCPREQTSFAPVHRTGPWSRQGHVSWLATPTQDAAPADDAG